MANRDSLVLACLTLLIAAGICFPDPWLWESLDYLCFYKPNFHFLQDALRDGRVPLWNPYVGLGRPFLADLQSAVFYPPLYFICLGQGIGLFLLVWSHCHLGALGMRALGRALGIGSIQSVFMTLCFLGSGIITARWFSGQILYACGICYLPALFGCAAHTGAAWSYRRIGLHALLLALQFLCGHPQVFWISCLGQGVFIMARSIRWPLKDSFSSATKALAQFGASCLWMLSLVAMVLLPFLELVTQGNRVGATRDFANYGRMDWNAFKSLYTNLSGSYNVSWEMNLYIGSLVTLLGILGLFQFKDPNIRGFWGVLLIAFLVGVGDHSPLFGFFFDYLPGFSSFRLHARACMLIGFVFICTAGLWLSQPHPWLRNVLRRRLSRLPGVPQVVMTLILLQAVFLIYANWRMRSPYSFVAWEQVSPEFPAQWIVVETLRNQGLMEQGQPPPRVCVPPIAVLQNSAMIHHYSTFDAYTSLFLNRPWVYLHSVLGLEPPTLLNTSVSSRIYHYGPIPYPDLAFAAGLDPKSGRLDLAVNPSPRAFVVYASRVVGGSVEIQRELRTNSDIHKCSLVERPLELALPEYSTNSFTEASIRRFEPNSMFLDVDAMENGLLVLAETWYPGWKAEIDGKIVPMIPANSWMRAVPLPAGNHQVRVFFHQNYLAEGLMISLASAGLLLLVGLMGRARSSKYPAL